VAKDVSRREVNKSVMTARSPSKICVICNERPADTIEHAPAEMFFDRPLPLDRVKVPACRICNNGSQKDDEYLREFLMALRSAPASQATENVRQRTIRNLHRPGRGGLLARFMKATEVGWIKRGESLVPEIRTRPEGERIRATIIKYARALHYEITREPLATDVVWSIGAFFNFATKPEEYWTDLKAAVRWVRAGETVVIGSRNEFRYSFRRSPVGDLIEVILLDFYELFPYAAMIFRPGTDMSKPVKIPF